MFESCNKLFNDSSLLIKQGDHVRVIGGRYEGDTGLIVRVEDNMIVLFSDLTMHELKTLPKVPYRTYYTQVSTLISIPSNECAKLDYCTYIHKGRK